MSTKKHRALLSLFGAGFGKLLPEDVDQIRFVRSADGAALTTGLGYRFVDERRLKLVAEAERPSLELELVRRNPRQDDRLQPRRPLASHVDRTTLNKCRSRDPNIAGLGRMIEKGIAVSEMASLGGVARAEATRRLSFGK